MRQLTRSIILVVFVYLQSINSQELFKQKTVFAYKGKILLKNVASDKLASIWTISGKLSVEDLTDHITFKLDDVKTRIFNGNPEILNSVHEKNLPEDAKIIQEPFVVYPGNKSGYNITHKPNEPIWSLNMKRSIANIFFLNTDKKTNSVVDETTIYGDCEVRYKIANNEGLTIWKTIDRKNCSNSPNFLASNVQWDPTVNHFETTNSETKRIYYFDGTESLKKVESTSLTTYQSMPGVRSKQIVEQSQEFTRISNTTTFDPLDIAEFTETSIIIYDVSIETEGKKEPEKRKPNELMKYFTENYAEFKEYFEKYPLFNTDDTMFMFNNMYEALFQMDEDTLLHLEQEITKRDDNLLQHMFLSYLPYLGTNGSLYYIRNLVAEDKVSNDLLAIKILATLPTYFYDINEEIVQELEVLMDLKNVANNQIKYAGILSFAAIVSTAYEQNVLTSTRHNKYVGIYFKNFQDAENYETKMVWLLGLINMANGLKNEDMVGLITNAEESRHIRVLAVHGFKDQISIDATSEMYKNMWPIVKNTSEPFEVRVACLDLLLSSRLKEEQFQNIVSYYKHDFQEPREQHLANYMYTSLKALQNTTGYSGYLGYYATETLREMKPRKLDKTWLTGNYRMAYTDSEGNFGASYQARLISNPVSHVLNSAFLTVNSFAHTLNFGRYSAYIKTEGIADFWFSYYFINDVKELTIPKLLKLVRKNAYRFKEVDDIHLDVVLFCQTRVVFSIHINKSNFDKYLDNLSLFIELLSPITDYNSLSYPLFDYNYYASDLGTALTIKTDVVEIVSYKFQGLNEIFNVSSLGNNLTECNSNYRSMWFYSVYTESYNPLIDASIATFKYIGEQKRIDIPFAFDINNLLLKWTHEKDAFNVVGDHLIGTMVDKENVLQEYCESCQQSSLINHDDWDQTRSNPFWQIVGITFNVTCTKLDLMESNRKGSLNDIMDHHAANTFDNIAKPFLLFNHYMTYNKYINNDLYRYSVRSIPYKHPSETIIALTEFSKNISVSLTKRKQSDAEILSAGNFTFRYFSATEANSSEASIHHKYNIELFSNHDIVPLKVCINRDLQYPSKRTNKLSLDSVEIAKATTKFSYGTVDNITSCPTKLELSFTEIYSASDNQKAKMIASNEYKNCVKQAKGLKYTPPTDDCFAAHEIISKYEICDIYADSTITETEYGEHLIRYAVLNDTHAKISLISEGLIGKFIKKPHAFYIPIDTTDFLPVMTINPRVVAYNDNYLQWGISGACYITPNKIRTFTGQTIEKYEEKSVGDAVAFVECIDTATAGMTIQKYGDKYVGFHFFSNNNSFTVSVPNEDGKLKIEFNDIILTRTNNTGYWLTFLDDDVFFLTLDVADIFYTGEYISVKINSIYNNYICGLCAETEHV